MTQEAGGDAAVFDFNGDLLMIEIKVGHQGMAAEAGALIDHGVFYSIIPVDGYTAA